MAEFFSPGYTGAPFVLFGTAHVSALATVVLLNIVLIGFRDAGPHVKTAIRWILAILLWSAELSWHIWNIAVGTWSAQFMLPLNICSILIWLSGLMLICKNFRIYEFCYFLGIGGAIQYLATPDLGIYGFPHFRFFQTFVSHGLLLTAPIYMTIVEGMRPTWKSVLRAVLWMNAYIIVVYFLNRAIGSDYLMINAKPAFPSLLDLLPAWPYYVVFMELIGLLTVILLYLPFAFSDRKARPAAA